jgi:hypothetical protein
LIETWLIVGLAVSLPQADVDRCLALEAEQARLACYDRLFDRPQPSAPGAAAAAASAAAVPAAAVPPVRVDAAPAPARDPAPQAAGEAPAASAAEAGFGLTAKQRPDGKVEAISGTVVAIEPGVAGRAVFVLDTGQRWRQVESTTRPAFENGETIVIRRASLGSYLATVPDSGRTAVRVRRQD